MCVHHTRPPVLVPVLQVQLQDVLGKGAFGTTFRANWRGAEVRQAHAAGHVGSSPAHSTYVALHPAPFPHAQGPIDQRLALCSRSRSDRRCRVCVAAAGAATATRLLSRLCRSGRTRSCSTSCGRLRPLQTCATPMWCPSAQLCLRWAGSGAAALKRWRQAHVRPLPAW